MQKNYHLQVAWYENLHSVYAIHYREYCLTCWSINKSYPTFFCDTMHTHNISLLTSERYAQLMFAHNIKLTSLMLLLQHVIQDSVLTKNFVDMIFYKIFLDIKKNSNRYRYIPFHSRCRLPRYSFWEDHYRDIAFHLRFLLDFPWFLKEILYKIISCKVFCIKLHDRLVWSLMFAIVVLRLHDCETMVATINYSRCSMSIYSTMLR